jgi:LmbE family N-acetylglucosaminyl deacetylase
LTPLVLLTVNGHPDDEVVNVGGVMARYAADGVRVVSVSATRGENGEIVAPDLDTDDNHADLGKLRAQELMRGLARLNPAIEHRFLGFRDSGMVGTASNQNPRAFSHPDNLYEATDRLVDIIREVAGQVIIAPNAYGGDGHPDHIRAHDIAHLAFERTHDANKLYASLDDLGRLEKIQRLVRSGDVREVARVMWRVGRTWRLSDERLRRRARSAQNLTPLTTRVDIGPYLERKYAALAEHRSQIRPGSLRFALTPEQRSRTNPWESFALVRARGIEVTLPEDDLFAGLRQT